MSDFIPLSFPYVCVCVCVCVCLCVCVSRHPFNHGITTGFLFTRAASESTCSHTHRHTTPRERHCASCIQIVCDVALKSDPFFQLSNFLMSGEVDGEETLKKFQGMTCERSVGLKMLNIYCKPPGLTLPASFVCLSPPSLLFPSFLSFHFKLSTMTESSIPLPSTS